MLAGIACLLLLGNGAQPAFAAAHRGPGRLPIHFVANDGDQPEAVSFVGRSQLGTTFVTRDAALVHVLSPAFAQERAAGDAWSLVERFEGGSTRSVRGDAAVALPIMQPDRDGRMREVRSFSSVVVKKLYPGIDLALEHGERGIERIYRIAPGGDPARIRVSFAGGSGIRIDADGRLLIETPHGVVAQSAPVAWQENARGRAPVAVRYRLRGEEYGFIVAKFDRTKPLFIDPIMATSYLGGSDFDDASTVAIHPVNGDIYVTGSTSSADFPGIAGGAIPIASGPMYVARFDRQLRTLRQATLLPATSAGSFNSEQKLAIHPSTGDVYVIGISLGSFPGLPAGSCPDGVVVARLTADLRALLGANCDRFIICPGGSASGVAIGPNGNVYVSRAEYCFRGGDIGAAPQTKLSSVVVVPVIVQYDASLAFKAQMRTGGGALAIHPTSGEIYALGTPFDAQIVRLSPALAPLASATVGVPASYSRIAVHPATGDVYMAGMSSGVLPGAGGGAQPTPGGGSDAIVTRLNANLSSVLQSTYFGGTGNEDARSLQIDPVSGDVFIGGYTESPNLPGATGSAQPALAGGRDGFIARFAASLTSLRRATYFGGSGSDSVLAIATDPTANELVIGGTTASSDLPLVTGSAQPALRGPGDGFIARLDRALSGNPSLLALGGGGQRAPSGASFGAPLSVRLATADNAPVPGVAVTFTLPSNGPRATFAGATSAVVVTDGDGAAISPPMTAALDPGTFVATATAGGSSVTFSLAVDPVSAVAVPANNVLALLLCVVGIAVAAAGRQHR